MNNSPPLTDIGENAYLQSEAFYHIFGTSFPSITGALLRRPYTSYTPTELAQFLDTPFEATKHTVETLEQIGVLNQTDDGYTVDIDANITTALADAWIGIPFDARETAQETPELSTVVALDQTEFTPNTWTELFGAPLVAVLFDIFVTNHERTFTKDDLADLTGVDQDTLELALTWFAANDFVHTPSANEYTYTQSNRLTRGLYTLYTEYEPTVQL